MKRKEEKTDRPEIRSEVTHEQEISITHPPPSEEIVEQINQTLQSIERILGASRSRTS